MKPSFFLLMLFLYAAPQPVLAMAEPDAVTSQSATQIDPLRANELKARGKALFEELEKTYRQMVAAQTIRFGQNILAQDLVAKFIPEGTSFADAEVIVKEAGFEARFEKTKVGLLFFTGAEPLDDLPRQYTHVVVGIDVHPKKPNDLKSGVGKTGAAIFVHTL